ncbi:hypothetical protein CI238_06165 [Colletotrichum incanum]|uniref:Cyanovirin-N domain-containing protein n=1 Tax=Colletotrichum incanum TaxID=1573173 RepID=A0A161Y8N3_COLIC|nr:hypothetical protein CI238_06165 [Colletotrichum incanum]
MRAIHIVTLLFLSLARAGSSEECLSNLQGLFKKKGVTDQPGLDTFGGACKGTRVVKEKLTSTSAREEWLLYSFCQKNNGEFGQARLLPLAESCKDCKVVDGSQSGVPGAHLRCSCAAPKQAAKTYELPIHANLWAEGDIRGERLSRYPCGVGSGMMDCGWARCVRNAYEHGNPPGHWHGPSSPDANDP